MSLSKVGSQNVADTRVFEHSDYYLENSFIETFADEVQPRQAMDTTKDGVPKDNAGSEDAVSGLCANHWKVASHVTKKLMWSIFEETGLF